MNSEKFNGYGTIIAIAKGSRVDRLYELDKRPCMVGPLFYKEERRADSKEA